MAAPRRYSAGELLTRPGNADVLAASCLSFFCVVGTAIAAPPTLFSSIAESVGVDVGELQLRLPTVLMLSWLLSTACAGSAMERLGVAPCIRLGSLAVALASTAYPLATSLRQLIVLHAVLGASMGLAGVFAHCLLMNVWFLERRGTAIAIVVAFFGAMARCPKEAALPRAPLLNIAASPRRALAPQVSPTPRGRRSSPRSRRRAPGGTPCGCRARRSGSSPSRSPTTS